MNRRDLLKGIAAAAIAASAGIELLPEQKKLIAKHQKQYSMERDCYIHRFAVRIGDEIHCVDALSIDEVLSENELQPMLAALERHIGNAKVVAA